MRGYVRYVRAIWSKTWGPTWAFIKSHILFQALIGLIAGLVAGYYEWQQSGVWPMSIGVGVVTGLIAAALLSGFVLLWNLVTAPYRLWAEQIPDAPIFDAGVADNLENLWERGDNLGRNRDQNTSLRGNEAVQVGNWINDVCSCLREPLPNEVFMFRSYVRIFNSADDQIFDILFKKLEKLRLIIGRYKDRRAN